MTDLFRIKPFLRLYSALFLAAASRNIIAVGIYIYTYEMTHSAMSVIIAILCRRTPAVFFGMFSGYLADYFHKRWVMALSEILSALAISLILLVHDVHSIGFIYVAYIILSLTVTSSHSCKSSAVSEIVPEQLLSTANTFLSSVQNVTMIFGSALGGILYSIVGIKFLVVLSMGLMVTSGFLIAFIRQIQRTTHEDQLETSMKNEILGGWNRIREIPELKSVFICDVLAVISFTVYNIMVTLYPLKLYGFASSGVGLFNSTYGLAALAGTIIIAKISLRASMLSMVKFRPYLLVTSGFIFILMSMTTSKILGITLFFVSVFIYMLFSLSQQNLLLHYAGKRHIGRVYSFDNMITVFVLTFAGLAYGKIGDLFHVSTLGYSAGIILIFTTVGYEFLSRIQKISFATVRPLILLLGLLSFLGGGCSKVSIPSHDRGQSTSIERLRLNLYAPFVHLDPSKIFDTVSQYIAQQVNRGLIQIDVAGQIKPAIAERWEISEDQKKYTFYLRKGVKFHNGREVIAEDFVYSFTRVVSPELESPVSSYLEKIDGAKEFKNRQSKRLRGIRALDRYTLEIKLAHPYIPFILILATPSASVVPKEAVEDKKIIFDEHPIGAGPYTFDRYDATGKKVFLKAYHSYFEGPPVIQNVECLILSEEEAYYRFLAKDLDYFKIGDTKWAEQLIHKGYAVKRGLRNGLAFIGINHHRKPLNDGNVRQALQTSLDWKTYQEKILYFGLEAADQFMPKDLFGRINTASLVRYNVADAQSLIKKSTFGQGRKPNKIRLLKFDLFDNKKEDAFFKESWAKIGLDVDIVYLERKDYRQKLHSKDFDLIYLRGAPDIPDPDNLIAFFHSNGSYNFFNYSNPTLDRLIDEGPKIPQFENRNKIYQQISHIIYEDVIAIPLYYYDSLQALQPQLHFGEYRYAANEDLYIITKAAHN